MYYVTKIQLPKDSQHASYTYFSHMLSFKVLAVLQLRIPCCWDWDMMLQHRVIQSPYFNETYCLHLQSPGLNDE